MRNPLLRPTGIDDQLAHRLLESVREQVSVPDGYAIYVEGSIAQGHGTPYSDVDVTIVPDDGASVPPTMWIGVHGEARPQILEINFQTIADLDRQAKELARLRADAPEAPAILLKCHRLLGACPLQNATLVAQIQAAFDRERLRQLLVESHQLRLSRHLLHARLLTALGRADLAIHEYGEAVVSAAEIDCARRGGAYSSSKWLIERLTRAGLPADQAEGITDFLYRTEFDLEPGLESTAVALIRALGCDVPAEDPADLVLVCPDGLQAFVIGENAYLVIADDGLVMLDRAATAVWSSLKVDSTLRQILAAIDPHVAAGRQALADLYVHGLVAFCRPGGDRTVLRQQVPLAALDGGQYRFTPGGVVLDVTAPALCRLAVSARAFVASGLRLLHHLTRIAASHEDLAGACQTAQWGAAECAKHELVQHVCTAMLASRGLVADSHDAWWKLALQQGGPLDRELIESLRRVQAARLRERRDAAALEPAVDHLLALIPQDVRPPDIARCYESAAAYLVFLELARPWSDMGVKLGVPYPHGAGQKMAIVASQARGSVAELVDEELRGKELGCRIAAASELFTRFCSLERPRPRLTVEHNAVPHLASTGSGVAVHVDLKRLLSGPADDFDARNAALVDGRAVHHYLQFIEPLMVEHYPDAAYAHNCKDFGASLLGGFSPWRHARSSDRARGEHLLPERPTCYALHGCVQIETVRCAIANGALIAGPPKPGDVARVASAIERLDEHRLGFFVELALGVVGVGEQDLPLALDRIPAGWGLICDRGSDLFTAGQLLVSAAREFAWQWVTVESFVRAPGAGVSRADRRMQDLLNLFAGSVFCEWERRVGGTLPRPPSIPAAAELLERRPAMLDWLAAYHTTPLCQELLACWFPGWHRSLFIFNSPFDPMASLRQAAQHRGEQRAAE